MPAQANPGIYHPFRLIDFLQRFLFAIGVVFALPSIPAAANQDSLSLFRYTQPVRMELLLPMDGPGNAPLNPARLIDMNRVFAQYGTRYSGDSRALEIALGAGFAQRVYLGASFFGASGKFDGTNAILLDNRFAFQAAYRHRLDPSGASLISIGLGETIHNVNGMEAFKGSRSTLDAGLLFVPVQKPGGWGMEFGLSGRDLKPFEKQVADNRFSPGTPKKVKADFAPWITTATLIATSPSTAWSLVGSLALGKTYTPVYWDELLPGWDAGMGRIYLPRLGMRFRLSPAASLSLERVWNQYWVAGISMGTANLFRMHIDSDLRLATGPHLQYSYPDKTGWTLGWNLRLGY
jgi:hypothetical protein